MTVNFASGNLNPHHFYHPHLYYYLTFFLDGLFVLAGLATGRFHHLSEAWSLFKTDPTIFYTIGRSLSALLGTLTIPLVYLMGKRVFNEKVGILGALFLTFSLLHVQWSQIAYMDVPLTFFVVSAFLFGYVALERGRLRDFVFSGLLSGLATSTKYQGVITFIWGLLVCLLHASKNHQNPVRALASTKHFLFILSFLAGFTLGTPFWLLSFREFFNHFRVGLAWIKPYGQGQAGMQGNWNWLYYLQLTSSYSVGFPVLAASLAGIFLLIRRMDPRRLFFLSFPLLYFLVAGAAKLRQVKYLMPVVPFLCIAAAFFVIEIIGRSKFEGGKRTLAALCLGGALVFPSLTSDLRYNYLKMFPDTRQLANEWVKAHAAPNSKILVSTAAHLHLLTSQGLEVSDLDSTVLDQRANNRSSLKSLVEYRKQGIDYLILDEWHLGLVLYEEAKNKKFEATKNQYLKLLDDLKQTAVLSAEFSPYREKNPEYDRENIFLASRSLGKLKRLGPLVWIYKL